jgi:hypothetical protein
MLYRKAYLLIRLPQIGLGAILHLLAMTEHRTIVRDSSTSTNRLIESEGVVEEMGDKGVVLETGGDPRSVLKREDEWYRGGLTASCLV